jgi:hypothetical protein
MIFAEVKQRGLEVLVCSFAEKVAAFMPSRETRPLGGIMTMTEDKAILDHTLDDYASPSTRRIRTKRANVSYVLSSIEKLEGCGQ